MANQGTDDNSRGHTTKMPQLPPKSPSFRNNGSNVFSSTSNPSMGWANLPFQNSSLKHQRSPSVEYAAQDHPSWMDDLIESPSEVLSKKGSHRRSASDSLAFMEAPVNSTAEGNRQVISLPSREYQDSDRLDQQLMSMFTDIEPFQKQKSQSDGFPTPCSEKQTMMSISDNPSSPSDHNSINEPLMDDVRMNVSGGQFKSEPEVQSACRGEQPLKPMKSEPPSSASLDYNIDPKRVKRIIANRQSAQRSRVRKLHYISELERSVNALQTEVSTISPQVAYLDHQRVILNIDNSALKERIAALVQDKIFKDAHSEALKAELQRLRQLYQNQQQHMEQEMTSNVAFNIQQQHFGKVEIGPSLQRELKGDASCRDF